MGIYIDGMGMPPHCFNCSTKVDPDNRRCNIDGHVFEETLEKLTCRRDDACPLVPIPAHGRLGDLDALYSRIQDEQRKCNDPYDGWSECQVALGFVNTAPTIIPADLAEEGET